MLMNLVDRSPRTRRRSELPTDRRMSISRSSLSSPLAMPARVSDAVSMISPLNPLPSPWASSPGPEFSTSPRTSGRNSSIDSNLSSGSGSIRLTRVPTSVRLAQDLLKTTPTVLSPEPMTGLNTPSVDQTNLADFPVEIAGGAFPATPSATRNVTPEETNLTIQEEPEPDLLGLDLAGSRKASAGDESNPPSPSRLKRNAPRQRPSLPPPSAFALPASPPNLFVPASRSPEIRPWALPPAISGFPSREPIGSSTSMTFLSPAARPGRHARNRSTSNEATTKPSIKSRMMSIGGMQVHNLAHDSNKMTIDPSTGLNSAGSGPNQDAEGDATRHANVIMQSRRAKIQRWRPSSSGTDGGSSTETPASKPLFVRGISATALGFRAAGEARPFRRVISGREPTEPTLFPLEVEASPTPGSPPVFAVPVDNCLERPIIATRQDSQGNESPVGEPIDEIEWVDWMDEYKRYKEAKIRAQQVGRNEKEDEERVAHDPSASSGLRTASPEEVIATPRPERQASGDTVASSNSATGDVVSRPSYSPRKSEDARPNASSRLHLARTLSLSHGGQSVTSSGSSDAKANLFKSDFGMVSRQPSLQSTRSGAFPGRKKKNIAAKMEGWWSAVKSTLTNPQHQSSYETTNRYGSESPHRHTLIPRKPPSAPSSRRGSAVPVDSSSLPVKREPLIANEVPNHHALRTATSHTNLHQLQEDLLDPRSVDLAGGSNKTTPRDTELAASVDVVAGLVVRPLPISRLSSEHQMSFQPSPPSSLEARRRQPPLSLKLENNVLVPPRLQGRQSSNLSSGASTSDSSARPSFPSHGRQESHASSAAYSAGGIAPGFRHWDQTPSPLMSLSTNRPEVSILDQQPGHRANSTDGADSTLASVRRHVRHRLTVAKEGCDRELRFIVSDITAFVEGHLHLPPAIAESEIDPEEVLQDSRAVGGLSPRTAYSDLEDETDIMDRELGMHSQGE
jgi:serine/threonine-protein kinase RIM15